jgi:hypothetical protein
VPGNVGDVADCLDPHEHKSEGLRRLLEMHDLPTPDEIFARDSGEVVCLWHEPRVALAFADDGALDGPLRSP